MYKKKAGKKPRTTRRFSRSRSVKYKLTKNDVIDYKNFVLLSKFLTDRGKVISRRVSGINATQQRRLTNSIRRAKFLGLLPVGGRG